MGYSKEFVELTNAEFQPTFEIKDISDKLGPGKHSDEVENLGDIICLGFNTIKYSKTEDGKLMCIMKDGTEKNFLDVLAENKPKLSWE